MGPFYLGFTLFFKKKKKLSIFFFLLGFKRVSPKKTLANCLGEKCFFPGPSGGIKSPVKKTIHPFFYFYLFLAVSRKEKFGFGGGGGKLFTFWGGTGDFVCFHLAKIKKTLVRVAIFV